MIHWPTRRCQKKSGSLTAPGGRDHGDQHDGADEELGEADPTERAGGEPGRAAH